MKTNPTTPRKKTEPDIKTIMLDANTENFEDLIVHQYDTMKNGERIIINPTETYVIQLVRLVNKNPYKPKMALDIIVKYGKYSYRNPLYFMSITQFNAVTAILTPFIQRLVNAIDKKNTEIQQYNDIEYEKRKAKAKVENLEKTTENP